ncbi:endonuclease III [Dehalogenimonas alkenigignens]|uniref:Endonuclease III n=1 Tax=Dehalogenimonas alkenigignens TaxID=1217799 RepID=A0A0W0GJC3_9CHLR|nr:endonuclease III [Dehalogenimonas alkenigignens]KTB48660.1 DNA-(apurinic or apyrimidinic site) lyase/endonuclease III [Dehalogenimonas alkenigignens]PVV84912.1 endonuclease III [Dehalogenimonas alkenigignens]
MIDRPADISETINRLKKAYPKSHIALNFTDPLQLLTAVILSAQTTDVAINSLTPALFAKYKTAEDYATADVEELEALIKKSGFYHQKAKSLIGMGNTLIDKFGGKVPQTMEELVQIPGAARKSANIVLWNAFGKIEGIAVDTHVARLSKRLGYTQQEDPVKIEKDLMKIVPYDEWGRVAHLLQDHGRAVCTARKPNCAVCFLNDICPSAFKV